MKLKVETSEGAQRVPVPRIAPLLALKSQIRNSLLKSSIALNKKGDEKLQSRHNSPTSRLSAPGPYAEGKMYMPGFPLIDCAVYSLTFITWANVRFTVRN